MLQEVGTTEQGDLVINVGPQHPSTHGVLHLVITLNGETIKKVEPHLGYIHRSIEKMCESLTYRQFIYSTSRMDYLSAHMNNHACALAVEQGLGVEIPPRARAIRILMSELTRIASHQLWWGAMAMDVGAITPFFHAFREREMIYDLWEAATGQRLINNNYFRIGGVAADLPYGWLDKCLDFCDWFGPKIDEYEKLITNNPIFRKRIEGLGTITREQAINWSLSGPMLRASGVPWDLRKVDHYECYDDFDWNVAWEKEGDCYARYRVRIQEMRESLKILRQACQMIPGGPTENLEARRMAEGKGSEFAGFDYQIVAKKVAPTFKIPSGELYTRLESGKGEIGVFIQGNDDVTPWRFKIRAADLNNLQILPHILKGNKVADIMAILGSIDVIMGSVDR